MSKKLDLSYWMEMPIADGNETDVENALRVLVKAITSGEMHGNPYCKPSGSVCDDTQ